MVKVTKRIRLRMPGAVFLLMTLLVLMAAWNTAANLLYIVFAALLSLLILSVVWPRLMFRKLTVHREAPERVHRDEIFGVTVRIENPKWLFPAFSIRIESPEPSAPPLGFAIYLPARRASVHTVEWSVPRRGRHRLPPLTLSTTFPFGLMELRVAYHDQVEVLVYPRVMALRASALQFRTISGDTPQYVRGEGDEFFSLREYVPGDDIRLIAWRASARLDKWIVRDHEPDTSRFIIVALDSRQVAVDGFDEALERAVELVASLTATLLNRQFTVALVTPDTAVPLGMGRAHTARMLEVLAELNAAPPTARDAFAHASTVHEGPGAAYIFVSADPQRWGKRAFSGDIRVLDPRGAYATAG